MGQKSSLNNYVVYTTPRTGSTFLVNRLAKEHNLTNHNEILRVLFEPETTHPLLDKTVSTIEEFWEAWERGNNVIKLFPYHHIEETKPVVEQLLDTADTVIFLERRDKRAQVLSWYAAEEDNNFTALRKGRDVTVEQTKIENILDRHRGMMLQYNNTKKDYITNHWSNRMKGPRHTWSRVITTEELPKGNEYQKHNFIIGESIENVLSTNL